MPSENDLLTEIRENFDYQYDQWADIREEGRKDMCCVAGDPWDPADRKERKGAGRLILSMDEVNQYCNQLINDVRQNKRAVKVLPKGSGSNDQTAEMRGGMIRQIEYKSKAQAAYRTAFEGVVQRSYGAWKYKTQYVSDSSFEQEIVICRMPNPDVIYMDWDAKEADFSDGDHAFEIDTVGLREFQRRWPGAKVQSFTTDHMHDFPKWVKSEKRVQVACYWKLRKTTDRLFQFADGTSKLLSELKEELGPVKVKGNYLQFESRAINFTDERKTEERQVKQYFTNGIEILPSEEGQTEYDWAGKYIPIVFITGKELYVDEGGGPKRKLMSLVRLAREPYMAYCYLWTAQVEMAQQMPKATLMGYEGQFDTSTDYKNLHKMPTGYAEFKATTAESRQANPQAILPPPQRPQYAFDVQSVEVMKESCKRAIQSACGITGLLNGANDHKDARSGVALKTMDQQESQGNFHFIDNFDQGMELGGRIMDDLLEPVYDSPREVGMRTLKGDHSVGKINQTQLDVLTGKPQKVGFHTDQGDHDVTITTGPSFASEREEAQDFGEQLTKTGDPELTRALLPAIIKLRNLGPVGEELAKIAEQLSPLNPAKQGQIPPQVQMQMQKMTALIQQLTMEKKAKLIEIQGKMQLEQQKQAGKNFQVTQQQSVDLQKTRMNNLAAIEQSLAKIGQATQAEQIGAELQHLEMLWESMHEFTQMGLEHQHELALGEQQHQQGLEQLAAQPEPSPAAQA
jgi:hypothetical protein